MIKKPCPLTKKFNVLIEISHDRTRSWMNTKGSRGAQGRDRMVWSNHLDQKVRGCPNVPLPIGWYDH